MKPTLIPLLLAAVILGLSGFMVGRQSSAYLSGSRSSNPQSRILNPAGGSSAQEEEKIRRKPARELARTRISVDPDKRNARLEEIMRGENPIARSRALLAFIDQLPPGDFESAIAHFRSLGITESRSGEYALLLTAWAGADPLLALAYAQKNTSTPFASDTILTAWASADPEAAIRWATENHKGDGANPYLVGIIRSLAETDPARATELLASMPRSTERGSALDFLLPHLLQNGRESTREWIEEIPDDSLRNGAMMRVAEKFAEDDPAGTVAWLIANPGEASNRRLDNVFSTWAKTDQAAALSSLESLPSGNLRSGALRGVVSGLAVEKPQEALVLMDRYQADVNDRVVKNFIWHSFDKDPGTAVEQISRIEKIPERDQMYRRALGAWKERDPAALQTWMERNPVPKSVENFLAEP